MGRNTVVQTFNPQVVAVAATPTPLSGIQSQAAYIDSLLITLYSTAANSIFLGDGSVTVNSGIEIPVGTTIQLSISNERVLYELQNPILAAIRKILCFDVDETPIPFVYWDMTQIFLIAAAPTNCVVTAFKRAYV